MSIKIENYSKYITNDELLNCLEIISEFSTLKNKVFIVDSPSPYLIYCLMHLRLYSLLSQIFNLTMNLFTRSKDIGYFNIFSRNIYLNTSNAFDLINYRLNKVFKSDLYNDNIDKYNKIDFDTLRSKWAKFIILDYVIHELCHAKQHKDKKLTVLMVLKNIVNPWGKRSFEIDAVRSTIPTFEKYGNNFADILDVHCIKICHSLNPLNLDYKLYAYNISK